MFYHNCLVHMSALPYEHTCTMTQHYNAFHCFIVTALKTHANKADLILAIRFISYDALTTRNT